MTDLNIINQIQQALQIKVTETDYDLTNEDYTKGIYYSLDEDDNVNMFSAANIPVSIIQVFLEKLTHITKLYLYKTDIYSIDFLREYTLECLRIQDSNFTIEYFDFYFITLGNLKELILLNNNSLISLSKMPETLISLELDGDIYDFNHITRFKSIEKLRLGNKDYPDKCNVYGKNENPDIEVIKLISELKKIQSLEIYHHNDLDIKNFSKINTLKYIDLHLSSTDDCDELYQYLGNNSLETIKTNYVNKGILSFSKSLKKLEIIIQSKTKIDDLKYLKELNRVEDFCLIGKPFNPNLLMKDFQKIKKLQIEVSSKIVNEHLINFRNLEFLKVNYSLKTDDVEFDFIENLKKIKELHVEGISKTQSILISEKVKFLPNLNNLKIEVHFDYDNISKLKPDELIECFENDMDFSFLNQIQEKKIHLSVISNPINTSNNKPVKLVLPENVEWLHYEHFLVPIITSSNSKLKGLYYIIYADDKEMHNIRFFGNKNIYLLMDEKLIDLIFINNDYYNLYQIRYIFRLKFFNNQVNIKETQEWEEETKRIQDKLDQEYKKQHGINRLKLNNETRGNYQFPYKNLLFKGVPGTGKSRIINEIILHKDKIGLDSVCDSNVLRINVHSASSNADLMQGIGLSTNNGQIIYKEKQGLILNHIKQAVFNPFEPYIIILEEIQENSLNELIGDLIYLIENDKRTNVGAIVEKDDSFYLKRFNDIDALVDELIKINNNISFVKVPYLVSNETKYKKLIIPDNLFFFCTSNYRDDKKIIEDNLLRRFDLIELYPKTNVVSKDVQSFFEELNQNILKHFGKSEIHPERFLLGHANWINVKDKKSFAEAFLKALVEFKDIREIEFDNIKPVLSKITYFPFDLNINISNYNNYKELINSLQEIAYSSLLNE